jgi:response regulator of citrate/malate metabolism
MAQKPIAMEQLKQILQLQADGISIREIARRVGISRNSVRKYLSRLKRSKVGTVMICLHKLLVSAPPPARPLR